MVWSCFSLYSIIIYVYARIQSTWLCHPFIQRQIHTHSSISFIYFLANAKTISYYVYAPLLFGKTISIWQNSTQRVTDKMSNVLGRPKTETGTGRRTGTWLGPKLMPRKLQHSQHAIAVDVAAAASANRSRAAQLPLPKQSRCELYLFAVAVPLIGSFLHLAKRQNVLLCKINDMGQPTAIGTEEGEGRWGRGVRVEVLETWKDVRLGWFDWPRLLPFLLSNGRK